MASCKDCLHVEICEDFTRHKLSPSKAEEILPILRERGNTCEHFKDRSRFVELPFEQNKGASPFDKVAHTTYTLATESHRVASFTIEGYYLMYNEERLYTLEKDGVVILVQGSSPHDVVEKAKLAIEKLSKERESNA